MMQSTQTAQSCDFVQGFSCIVFCRIIASSSFDEGVRDVRGSRGDGLLSCASSLQAQKPQMVEACSDRDIS
jgi:hypothetical protein